MCLRGCRPLFVVVRHRAQAMEYLELACACGCLGEIEEGIRYAKLGRKAPTETESSTDLLNSLSLVFGEALLKPSAASTKAAIAFCQDMLQKWAQFSGLVPS